MDAPARPPLPLVVGAPGQVDTDLIAVPLFEDDDLADVAGLDAATAGEIHRARQGREITGKLYELFLTPVVHHWHARRVLLVGAGPRSAYGGEQAGRVAAASGLAARQRRVGRLAFVHRPSAAPDAPERQPLRLLQSAAEGLSLAHHDNGRHKSTQDTSRLADVRIVAQDLAGLDREAAGAAVERGRLLGECTNLARDLGNEPSNHLTPSIFAERAEGILADTALEVEVLDEAAIGELGMGLLLGVSSGSAEPARLIVMRHRPPGAPPAPVLGLVGKGITFDTGGISIKPADGMERMKSDMSGGAAVIAAMRAISLLRVPIQVIGVVPATENMPGGRAVKPGDVLRGASGTTVEVVNTDAEGRLILGDGLWYAREQGATHLVDVATLTGACVVALGRVLTGLFGRPDDWVEAVRAAGTLAGERAWPMPALDEYKDQLRSEVADLSNTGGRPAGAITAAVFLKQFAGDLPWAHLDIAGTAWLDEPRPWLVRGATGVAVRTLTEVALGLAAGRGAVK